MPLESAVPERDAAFLLDMLTAASAVQAFVHGHTLEEYLNDLLLRSAVERQVEPIDPIAPKVDGI